MSEQKEIFDFQSWKETIPCIGWFYEKVAEKLFNARRLKEIPGVRKTGWSVTDPDLMSNKNCDWAIEVKGSNRKYGAKLNKEQWDNFETCIKAGFPYTKLWYAIFSYDLKGVSQYKREDDLLSALAGATHRCLLIDHTILREVLKQMRPRNYINWGWIYGIREERLIRLENGEIFENFVIEKPSLKEKEVEIEIFGLKVGPFKIVGLLNGSSPLPFRK